MQVSTNSYTQANNNTLQNQTDTQVKNNTTTEELTLEEQIEKSAVEVALSMNAQIILLSLDAGDQIKDNTDAQKSILNFLSGKSEDENFNLENTGYEGKPITELSQEEASELVSEEGFFGITQTSQRVADFVFGFSGDDLEKLETGREGIVKGFEEAQEMWGGELPEISHQTQARTLELIDAKIAELTENQEIKEESITNSDI